MKEINRLVKVCIKITGLSKKTVEKSILAILKTYNYEYQ